MDANICIFCKNDKIHAEVVDDDRTTISCDNCKGKYTINNRKGLFQLPIYLVKTPKGNINVAIPSVCILIFIPIGGLILLLDIPIDNIIATLFFMLYANFVVFTAIIGFLQNVYNYIFKGYLLGVMNVITKETREALVYKILVVIEYIIGGIIMSGIFIYMDYNFIKYLIKL